jgi:hypothetical protein
MQFLHCQDGGSFERIGCGTFELVMATSRSFEVGLIGVSCKCALICVSIFSFVS